MKQYEGCMKLIKTTRPPAFDEQLLLNHCITHKTSFLAAKLLVEEHQLTVRQSAAGFYLGCWDDQGPVGRDSEYFPTREAAQEALDNRAWTQRLDA